ncbi:MAG: hypothetical protein K940chlam7_01686 [Chlamydiae bacterium]|nr:hypothetical protein [Chlamydiota bacterium]
MASIFAKFPSFSTYMALRYPVSSAPKYSSFLIRKCITSNLTSQNPRFFSTTAKNIDPSSFSVQSLGVQNVKVRSFPPYFDFFRHYSVRTTQNLLAEKSERIRKTFKSMALLSEQEQRTKLTILLAKELGFQVEGEHITEKTVKAMLQSTTSKNEDLDARCSVLVKTKSKWTNTSWNNALAILFRRYAMKNFHFLSFERMEELLPKISPSMWRVDNRIPFRLSGDREEDKEQGLKISVKKITEWRSQNPNGKVVAIQEGMWDGNFLIKLYIQLTNFNITTKLVATDINPAFLTLFKLKCDLLGIPSEDFLVYFNSLHRPINLHEIEELNTSSLDTQILNIYFRVILDLEENETLQVFKEKAKEMSPDDLLLVTLIEETPQALQVLNEEIKMKKEKEGEFFVQYSNRVSNKVSTVLVLKEGRLQKLLSYLEGSFQVYGQEKVEIIIAVGLGESSPFEAVVVAFQLKK